MKKFNLATAVKKQESKAVAANTKAPYYTEEYKDRVEVYSDSPKTAIAYSTGHYVDFASNKVVSHYVELDGDTLVEYIATGKDGYYFETIREVPLRNLTRLDYKLAQIAGFEFSDEYVEELNRSYYLQLKAVMNEHNVTFVEDNYNDLIEVVVNKFDYELDDGNFIRIYKQDNGNLRGVYMETFEKNVNVKLSAKEKLAQARALREAMK